MESICGERTTAMSRVFRIFALVSVIVSLNTVNSAEPEPPDTFTNSVGMEFQLIPAGEFMMGSAESAEELAEAFPHTPPTAFEDELPQHRVRITKPFYLGVTEVTQAQYRAVVNANLSQFEGGTRPVETVSWDEAVAFCEKLSANEGRVYRLPTEAEWEYACRAGTTTRYCFGDDPLPQDEDAETLDSESGNEKAEQAVENEECLGDYAWYEGNSEMTTHEVAQKKPNAWGLYDMYGNVWEWCGDWYGKEYYASSPEGDPAGPDIGGGRVTRGGSYSGAAWGCRSSLRSRTEPAVRLGHLGFRVVAVWPAEPLIPGDADPLSGGE